MSLAVVYGCKLQNLVEKITRNKIYASVYWKKDCFGLSAETLVDKAVELKYVGGMIGEPQKPTEFICLLLKMLQIQPDKEIVIEFIKNDDYKYVRLLGEQQAGCGLGVACSTLPTYQLSMYKPMGAAGMM